VTSRTDEIQKLIADIDNLLNSNGKRLSRLLSSQAQEPKEVLEKVRNFLVSLQGSETSENEPNHNSRLLTKFVEQGQNQSAPQPHQPHQEDNNIPFQQLKNELSELIQPLQGEITALLQERTILAQEIRQLEQKRLQNYSLSQQLANQEQIITDFLQVLMSRLLPVLTPQITEGGVNPTSYNSSNSARLDLPPAITPTFWESSEQGDRLTQLTKELDQRLLSLDGTVNVVFEALQRNINTYHESLSQALARMHSTGLQSEQLMAGFINNWTQSLQQLSNFQPSVPKEENPAPTAPPPSSIPVHTVIEVSTPTNSSSTVVRQESTSTVGFDQKSPSEIDTDELDAVLLQLGVDAPLSLENPDNLTTLLPNSWEFANDEVDLIYASLFGNDNFAGESLEVSPDLITPDLLELNVDDSSPGIESNFLAEADTAAIMPDVWFDQSDTDLFDFSDTPEAESPEVSAEASTTSLLLDQPEAELFNFSDAPTPENPVLLTQSIDLPTEPAVPLNVSVLPEIEPVQPNSTDTITSLVDIEFAEELADVPVLLEQTDVLQIAQDIEVITPHEQPEDTTDHYIPASPQENLLSSEVTQLVNPPDISLNEEQWLQLHQDLAKLDDYASSESEPVTELKDADTVADNQEKPIQPPITETSNVVAFSVPEVNQTSVIPPATNVLNLTTTNEKPTEVPPTGQNNPADSTNHNVNKDTDTKSRSDDSIWYLGIDLGTTGISAALLNRSTGVVHPIYWSTEAQPGANSFQQSFRLPAEVYLPTASVPQVTSEQEVADIKNHLYSVQLKPYLQVAIPYKNEQQRWEPVLQFNESSAGPLIWVVRSLSKLLLTLKADRYSTTQGLIATAVGLNQRTFHGIVSNIAGIICNCPASWSEQYRFNVREALLTSKLVQHPQQVFFVEEAIASLLSFIDGGNGQVVQLSTHQGLSPAKNSDHALVGNTLIMNIGGTATEMALVDIPENLSQLTHNNFMLHSFAYASKGIEQDIICQLLASPKYRKARWESPEDNQKITSNPWQWQPSMPGLDRMQWESLGLEKLELPRLGEPDIPARIRLQQHLESSLLGQAVLDAALALKLILQHQESFTLELADQRWVLQRRELESQVFVPFARRLNRELNKLLVARGIPTEAINQAILTGGVANLGVVNLWLRQKLPNAKIIQDSYLGENGAPNCSRVACGLALLPLHSQVLEESRHQYTDYFLFTELLRVLPNRTLSFSEILQLFEGRGINTNICQQRLLAFLEGELPAGLVPASPESSWLTQHSLSNLDYQAMSTTGYANTNTPLFEKQGNLTYRPNSQQLQALHRYLDAIKASTQQSLEEPYTVDFAYV